MVGTGINLKPNDNAIFKPVVVTNENQAYKNRQNDIRILSEEQYLYTVKDVVIFSKENLKKIHKEKLDLRRRLIDFCLHVLGIQITFLLIFLFFGNYLSISDNVLSVYMTAVLAETLGAVIVMIKYAFKSDEEVKIIDILNAVVKNFQKYKDTNDDEKK